MNAEISEKRCPKCGASNLVAELPQREYRCGDCGLELAHLDTNAQGAIRGVLSWILDVGTEIDERYRVTAVLGKGGFGVTYLVDDLRLHGKRRALKEIPEVLFDEHETRLLGRLSHPAVPDITDRFKDAEMVYLVLEFGGNRTLRIEQERRGGRIPLFVLLPWIRQLCDALQYLHEQDPPVVHRDLKPDNILLDDNDRVMLIDFGIAKEAAPDTATRTLGRAVSHGFSPPEQVLGTGTDARSDVYALGAIIYNLLTDRMPAAAHERITGTAIEPLSSFLPEIPPLIEAAVMRALELNINLRQQSIAELAQVFDLVQSGTGSAATVSVGSVGTVSGPTTGGQVVLPSVQLPSVRSSSLGGTHPSVRIEQPGVAPVVVPAKRSRAPMLALAASLVAVAGGGYWYLEESGFIAELADGKDASPHSAKTDDKPATSPSGVAGSGDATAAIRVPEQGKPVPAAVAAPTAVATIATESGVGLSSPTGVGGKGNADVSATKAPTFSSAELPSIFSEEQNTASVPVQSHSGGSLMDVFEKHRGEALDKQPVASIAPIQPVHPPVSTVKPKKATKKKARRTASTKRRKSKSAPSSAAAWGFKYKGAEKQ